MQNESVQGTISGITSEGAGILKKDGLVIFVPFTAPLDEVAVDIKQKKKNYATATLKKILVPSPSRTKPLCPYYGTCGGCQLQHIEYDSQVKLKTDIVQNALQRLGSIKAPINQTIPAHLNWAYRRHITLHLESFSQGFKAGFIETDNVTLLEVSQCPIFIESHRLLIQEAHTFIKFFSYKNRSDLIKGKSILFKIDDKEAIIHFSFDKSVLFNLDRVKEFLDNHPHWKGLSIFHGKEKTFFGSSELNLEVDELNFTCSPFVFVQNHPEQSLKIYQQIVSLASQLPQSKIFDLYCGIGISSLLLAKNGHQVIGVEYTPKAIEFAKQNAQKNHINNAKFFQGDVELVLKQQLKKESADIILVNPPRVGMTEEVVLEIIAKKPKIILYISCNPATLQRDLKNFLLNDYEIELIQPYDMFPQTSHVETVVKLSIL